MCTGGLTSLTSAIPVGYLDCSLTTMTTGASPRPTSSSLQRRSASTRSQSVCKVCAQTRPLTRPRPLSSKMWNCSHTPFSFVATISISCYYSCTECCKCHVQLCEVIEFYYKTNFKLAFLNVVCSITSCVTALGMTGAWVRPGGQQRSHSSTRLSSMNSARSSKVRLPLYFCITMPEGREGSMSAPQHSLCGAGTHHQQTG